VHHKHNAGQQDKKQYITNAAEHKTNQESDDASTLKQTDNHATPKSTTPKRPARQNKTLSYSTRLTGHFDLRKWIVTNPADLCRLDTSWSTNRQQKVGRKLVSWYGHRGDPTPSRAVAKRLWKNREISNGTCSRYAVHKPRSASRGDRPATKTTSQGDAEKRKRDSQSATGRANISRKKKNYIRAKQRKAPKKRKMQKGHRNKREEISQTRRHWRCVSPRRRRPFERCRRPTIDWSNTRYRRVDIGTHPAQL